MRALKDRSLPAIRDNRNRWRIDQDELDRWSTARAVTGRPLTVDMTADTSGHVANSAEIAALRAENGQLRERLDELRQDRDAWREQAQRLASKANPRGFIAWLLRRS